MQPEITHFAEVLLPLPLYSTYTYRIPSMMDGKVGIGYRVIVPFGKKKFYTGIVLSIHSSEPKGYEVKEIAELLDTAPIVKHPQLKLWDWISQYYLCPPGDVLKAALPAGLKVESETFVEVDPDYEESIEQRLTEREAIILQQVSHNGKMSVDEIKRKSGLSSVEVTISRMVEKGSLIIAEKLVERYRPKKETFVRLAIDRNNQELMHKAFDAVKGAKKQEQLLIALIDALNKRHREKQSLEVSRNELLKSTGLSTAIAAALAQKGVIEIFTREINRFKYSGVSTRSLPTLSEAQAQALNEIHTSFLEKNITLLHGVTSSGKTEIYTHLIDHVLKKGEQVLYLVPEIALTTQLTMRLQRVFGEKVIIYHSKFSDNERVDLWKRILTDASPCVILGARSSVFLPFSKLGLVIVDEEHETSYKQFDPAPRYNARDTGIVLASMHGAKTLLGSATPAIETYNKALEGKYGLVTLSQRYEGVKLPDIELIDLKEERNRQRLTGPISYPLVMQAREALKRKEQIILFHNRRGFAPVIVCRQCGYVPKCQNCDVSLTYHRRAGEMVCHYCGATYKMPTMCPACKEPAIEVYGYGTERIENVTAMTFPDIPALRMDLDTTRNKDGYENIISDFSQGKAQILIGTQMVTKGLDFDKVSIVGVLNADTLLNFPDFRSGERAFNMLAQVSGRAGRRNTRGKVVIQTSQPAHPILAFVKAHNYLGYFQHELEERRRFNYPPFTRIINIYLKHRDETTLTIAASQYSQILRQLFGNRVFGPEEPYVGRVQSLYIRKIMLKIEINASMKKVKDILRHTYESFMENKDFRSLQVYYDVDPM